MKNKLPTLLGFCAASLLLASPALADCIVTGPDGKRVFISGTCSENLAQQPQVRINPYQPHYNPTQYSYNYGYGYTAQPYYSRYHVQPDYYRTSSNDNIAAVQTKLIRLGYWVGPEGVNGIRGSDTIQAIKDFQRSHGLKVDGVVGTKTAYKLNERSANFDLSNRWVGYPGYQAPTGYYR
jgi:hypothetical protein